jgi:predicted  nucleic acid-binding Zn-ribbon protein
MIGLDSCVETLRDEMFDIQERVKKLEKKSERQRKQIVQLRKSLTAAWQVSGRVRTYNS